MGKVFVVIILYVTLFIYGLAARGVSLLPLRRFNSTQ
jgi:hypothetical protein